MQVVLARRLEKLSGRMRASGRNRYQRRRRAAARPARPNARRSIEAGSGTAEGISEAAMTVVMVVRKPLVWEYCGEALQLPAFKAQTRQIFRTDA